MQYTHLISLAIFQDFSTQGMSSEYSNVDSNPLNGQKMMQSSLFATFFGKVYFEPKFGHLMDICVQKCTHVVGE